MRKFTVSYCLLPNKDQYLGVQHSLKVYGMIILVYMIITCDTTIICHLVPPGDPQHQMMAQHYRNIIINAMKEYDNSHPNELYENLSWIGLMGSGQVNPLTGLP